MNVSVSAMKSPETARCAPPAKALRRLHRVGQHMLAQSAAASTTILPHWHVTGARDPVPVEAGDPGFPTARNPDAPMSVFLLIGQSSMAGRGVLPAVAELIPDIHNFHYDYDEWAVAREPLHLDPIVRDAGVIGKSAYPTGTGLGLGYSFAKEILASGAVDGPVGLVPCAFGGSALSRWEKQPGLADAWEGDARNIPGSGEANGKIDGDLYARMARRTKLALKQPLSSRMCGLSSTRQSCRFSSVSSGTGCGQRPDLT
jgi:hypothetical protein